MSPGAILSPVLVFCSVFLPILTLKALSLNFSTGKKKIYILCNSLPWLTYRDVARLLELLFKKAFELLIKMRQINSILQLLFSLFTSILWRRSTYNMLLLSPQVNSSFVLFPLTLNIQCSNDSMFMYFQHFPFQLPLGYFRPIFYSLDDIQQYQYNTELANTLIH